MLLSDAMVPVRCSHAQVFAESSIREMNEVAVGRVVLTDREDIIALEPLDKGLMGALLRIHASRFAELRAKQTRGSARTSPPCRSMQCVKRARASLKDRSAMRLILSLSVLRSSRIRPASAVRVSVP
jgi:hypothetical protein